MNVRIIEHGTEIQTGRTTITIVRRQSGADVAQSPEERQALAALVAYVLAEQERTERAAREDLDRIIAAQLATLE